VKDKLFSIISHDLRNPLATMQSFLKLITQHHEKLDEEEKKKLVKEAQGSLDYLNELLYNLLQWSKSQMHLLEFKPETLQAKTVIEKNIRLLYLQAHMKQVQINTSVDEKLTLFADKEMLDFIIRNLLSNAIKFSHKNSTIDIEVQSLPGAVSIAVMDEGVGMSEETKQQLLQASLSNSRRGTAKERGTGLGLLICKEFIARHGGELVIEQRAGKGSIFKVILPA
jgi:K+-sensing histidine kinase KdpD